MKYRVGLFLIDTDKNIIISENKEQPIRPKTLELLLYFLEHNDEIISKQKLLDDVWKSVGAQEHVLFQSVKEIRSLFAPLIVIKTHPRSGYQWLVTTEKPERLHDENQNIGFINRKYWLSVALLLLLLPLTFYFSQIGSIKQLIIDKININPSAKISISRELVILPIENNITDINHGWIRLGAMDMLINQLSGKNDFNVFPSEAVLMALSRSNSFDIYDIDRKSQAMRSELGEVVTLHSKLMGTPMDYQLHFSLLGRYKIKQGIVFAKQIPDLFDKLTVQVMKYYQSPNDQISLSISGQTADHNFLRAMELFHRQDYHSAIHYLATVLKTNPENLKAQRYLLKSYIATNNYKEAQRIGEEALAIAIKKKNNEEHLRIVFELGVLAIFNSNFDLAHQLILESRSLANTHNDMLYAAYSHTQLGHILLKKNQWVEAELLYQTALEYHRGFQCPYGQISNLTALADLHQQQKLPKQAEQKINEAIAIASAKSLTFEHILLLLNKAKFMHRSDEREQWLSQVNILINTLENGHIKNQLKNKLIKINIVNTVQ